MVRSFLHMLEARQCCILTGTQRYIHEQRQPICKYTTSASLTLTEKIVPLSFPVQVRTQDGARAVLVNPHRGVLLP